MGTYTNYSKLEVDGTISSSVQGELIGTFTSMPSASALNEGKTIYYTGATSGNYVQNTFYTCTKSGSTYSWTSASPKQVSVDSALSETSTNPVQNKVIATALKGYATKDDIATVYKPKGSVASANLPTNPRIGDVYNLTDNSSYGPAGTNVVYTEDGTWDALAGIVDISGKQDKISAGTGISLSGNTVSLATSGVTAGTKGSATAVPVITVDAYGRVTSIGSETIYPPTTVGTSGQIWVSDGSGAGAWQSKDTTPTSGSTNAITSGAVYTALAGKQPNLSFDSTPTQNSSNPVTSGGVYNALAGKQPTLVFDSAPTSGSSNPVTSGGIYTAIEAKQSKLTFDTTPKSGSNNPVTSGGIFSAINSVNSSISSLQSTVAGKQDKLTFDSAPTSGSNNPVTSGGIFNAINSKQNKLTFDSTPTEGSSNPVTSGGIYDAIKAIPIGTQEYFLKSINKTTVEFNIGSDKRNHYNYLPDTLTLSEAYDYVSLGANLKVGFKKYTATRNSISASRYTQEITNDIAVSFFKAIVDWGAISLPDGKYYFAVFHRNTRGKGADAEMTYMNANILISQGEVSYVPGSSSNYIYSTASGTSTEEVYVNLVDFRYVSS